ncbi:uncharacterized protein [Dendrobates tinctorius]|uniref:uncharacterized protein n=1 Tax=Dendrobates tinctorius TaxID=92724 RepID=UPI003CC9278B
MARLKVCVLELLLSALVLMYEYSFFPEGISTLSAFHPIYYLFFLPFLRTWCCDVNILGKGCSPDLEYLALNCRPFYAPREFSSMVLVAVYIPPQASVKAAIGELACKISEWEKGSPEAFVIVMGDFNKGKLNLDLPKFTQHINCFTRENNTLDHCYTVLKGAYRAVRRAAVGFSDHCLIHLIPAYRQRLKTSKPTVYTKKTWSEEAKLQLQACFECTDWEVFQETCSGLDEWVDAVSSYIRFCEDTFIPSKSVHFRGNNKPWFTNKVRLIRKRKEEAYKAGDITEFKKLRNSLSKEIKLAKHEYAKILEERFSSKDTRSAWRGLREVTIYKSHPTIVNPSRSLAAELNEFYCRFEASSTHSGYSSLSSSVCSYKDHSLCNTQVVISEAEVIRILKGLKVKKAPGPDGVSPMCLKVCATQLAPILTNIYNVSLKECVVPQCWKNSTIIPVPKKVGSSELNDYRPVALTSVAMKVFERIMMSHLIKFTQKLWDPLQFAYKENRSANDTVNLALKYILDHTDERHSYVRILFMDFSSAFNTIDPNLLHKKMVALGVPLNLCLWIYNFLTARIQSVKVGPFTSDALVTNIGAPQGCVLSPLLFSLYTNDCISSADSVKILKFADDMTLIGLIRGNAEDLYRSEVERICDWCKANNLVLNTKKTAEMVVDFRKDQHEILPIYIHDEVVLRVTETKFLGVIISHDLKWGKNVDAVIRKAQQRMFFLRQLKRYGSQ